MKKKILALCLVVVLAVTAVTGVTLAYFTDTETKSNVMTMGKLDIEIQEKKLDGTDFDEDEVKILPSNNVQALPDGFDPSEINNFVEKGIHVVNKLDSTDAWLRAIILFEVPKTSTVYEANDEQSKKGYEFFYNKVWLTFNGATPTQTADSTVYGVKKTVTIDGTEYAVAVCYPTDADGFKPNETYKALMGFAMGSDVTSAEMAAMGEKYDVLVLAQGLQKDAAENLNAVPAAFESAFGKLTTDNIAKWFAGDDYVAD